MGAGGCPGAAGRACPRMCPPPPPVWHPGGEGLRQGLRAAWPSEGSSGCLLGPGEEGGWGAPTPAPPQDPPGDPVQDTRSQRAGARGPIQAGSARAIHPPSPSCSALGGGVETLGGTGWTQPLPPGCLGEDGGARLSLQLSAWGGVSTPPAPTRVGPRRATCRFVPLPCPDNAGCARCSVLSPTCPEALCPPSEAGTC